MNNEPNMTSDICTTISGNNLEAVLFSDFTNQESMIITADNISDLAELDGALCYDETTNELVYVNMIQPNLNGSDALSSIPHSVFSAIENGTSSLTDLSTFNDENQIMLLANGSIVIPNEDDVLVTGGSDPFVLEFVQNPPVECTKENDKNGRFVINRLEVEDRNGSSHELVGDNNDSLDSDLVNAAVTDDDLIEISKKSGSLYNCTLCCKTFVQMKDYRIHLLTHKDNVHKCNYCETSFNKLKNLMLHEVIHNPEDMACPLPSCKKKFRRLASLKAHIKIHEEEETLACPECGEEFRNQMYLELHYKYQPQCRIPDTEITVNDSKSCKLCDREFSNFNALVAHKKEHEKIKKALKTKSHRKKSLPSKPSSRINRCKVCPKWFLKPSQLLRHMRIHTGERPFECTQCPKAFNQANSLKIHMLKHTGDRPYLCPFCQSGFSQRGNLRQHINRVHSIPKLEDHVYKCSECTCTFRKICSLNAHRNRVHQQKCKLIVPDSSDGNQNTSLVYSTRNGKSPNLVSDDGILDGIASKKFVSADQVAGDKMNGKQSKRSNQENMYLCTECPRTFKQVSTLKTHLNEVHAKNVSVVSEESENCITIENNLDDVDDEDWEDLLTKRTTVNTITIAIDKGKGELWNQKVYVTKKDNARYYQCSHCPKQSTKLNELIRHIKVTVMGKPFKCMYCAKTFTQHSTFVTHLTLHMNAKTYQCEVCQQNFPNPAELNIHSKLHAEMNCDFMCMSCFKSLKEGEKHQCIFGERVLDDVEVKTIESGSKLHETSGVQRLHDKINLILPPYTCSHCNLTFQSYSKLKSHLPEHEGNKILLTDAGKDITCELRNKKFRSKGKHDAHWKSHFSEEAEHKCSQCGKSYKDAKALKRHAKKMHSTDIVINADAKLTAENVQSVLNLNSTNAILERGVTTKSCSNAETVNLEGNISDFIINGSTSVTVTSERPSKDLVAISYTIPVNGDLSIATGIAIDNPVPSLTNAIVVNNEKAPEVINIDTALLQKKLLASSDDIKEDLSYVVTGDSLEDCFVDNQVAGLSDGSTFNSTSSMYSLSGDIIYKCTKCTQQYSSELDLRKHFQQSEVCSTGIPSTPVGYFYACNTCYLTFKSVSTFLRHLETHNGNGTFSCLYCDTSNKTGAELTQHIAQHALKKEYPCIHCGELSDSADGVKQHITETHLMSSQDNKSIETKRKKNACNELLLSEKEKSILVGQKPNKFSSISEKVLSSLLKSRIKTEECCKDENVSEEDRNSSKSKKRCSTATAKENICSYCSRSFKKMCDLIRHIRIHTGEKPFKCDYCNKCFTVKSILNCHLKRHFTVKNIFCHICNRFFSTVGSLKIHMRLHTGDRPYKCLYCKETFRTSGHRDSHQKRHAGEKDRARQATLESAMTEIGNDDGLDFSVGDTINMHDETFLMPEMTYMSNFKFQEEIDLVNLNTPPPSSSSSHECTVCDKSFKRKADLDRHTNIHFRNYSHHCEICDSKFNQLDTLKAHLRRHIPPSPVRCVVCEKTFASAKNLKVHKLRQHPETLEMAFADENEEITNSVAVPQKSDSEVENRSAREATRSGVVVDLEESGNTSLKWVEQDELNLSALVGKSKKSDSLPDFFIMEKNFDLNTMISDFFPDDEK